MNTIRKLLLLTALSLVTAPVFAETKVPAAKDAQPTQTTAKVSVKKQKVAKAKVHKKSGRSAKKSGKTVNK
jgi:hypothetical protein